MNKNILSLIKKYFEKNKRQKTFIIVLATLGIFFIILSNWFSVNEQERLGGRNFEPQEVIHNEEEIIETALVTHVKDLETQYEDDLKLMLNQINGVTEVEVMVNIDSTNVNIYEKDIVYGLQTTTETDQSGGRRNITDETRETKLVYIRQGDQEVPVLMKTEKPPVRGVFIIAKGVENAQIKQLVVEAVSRVLDVPTYRISVLPK